MMHRKQPLPIHSDGSMDIDQWISRLPIPPDFYNTVKEAVQLAQMTGSDQKTRFGSTCFLQGLELAEIIAELGLDQDAIAASVLFSTVKHTDLKFEDITPHINKNIAKLLQGLLQMGAINLTRQKSEKQSSQQIDNIRKMILAMASDIRIVVIKLADRLCLMRELKHYPEEFRLHIAQETLDIFAPLANRLGLQQIKWELEDLTFFIRDPLDYKAIAVQLDERRIDREKRVTTIVKTLEHLLKDASVEGTVYGRAKHIYGIKRKMEKKHISFHEVYDTLAVRILVHTLEDCYKTLSIVHKQWEPIPKEFDDYISQPKPNGYQSIHTAVNDKNHKKFEIQIRTTEMHNHAELGIAAHWKYKEGKQQYAYEDKISWLRQILAWQKDLLPSQQFSEHFEQNIFKDRIYVFTPENDIIDLSFGATPLDFAYHIHTQVGHHCHGAKVNGKMVPLSYPLKMGDRIEILTSKKALPSRDWLSPSHGYLKTPHAKAKVLQWFKKQQLDQHSSPEKSPDENIAPEIIKSPSKNNEMILNPPLKPIHKKIKKKNTIAIQGMDNLLTKTAKCCKPIPGDPIIGYITHTQGITIHHQQCPNIVTFKKTQPDRLIEASWNQTSQPFYPVDIKITAYENPDLGREVTLTLANDRIHLLNLNTFRDRKSNLTHVVITLETTHIDMLTEIIHKLSSLSHVISVKRISL